MTAESTSPKKQKARMSRWRWVHRWLVRLLVAAAISVLLGAMSAGAVLFYFSRDLPQFDSLEDYQPPQVTRVWDRKGRLVAEFFDEKRTVVPFSKIPLHVRQAFLAAEDAEFYQHKGMDFAGLLRAFWANVRAGRVVQGGSTITQQVIKTFILGPEKSYSRKIRELLLAVRLENNLTKDEILSLYLNQIYFGHGCYGLLEASRFYFDKETDELSLAEGATLAALPKSPVGYSPLRKRKRALARRNWVLGQMARNGMIDDASRDSARQEPLVVHGKKLDFCKQAPYYAEHIRRVLEKRLGTETLLKGGLRVELALDLDAQRAAREAMKEGLRAVDRRQGYRGPLGILKSERREDAREKLTARLSEESVWTWEAVEEDKNVVWRARTRTPAPGMLLVVPVEKLQGKGKKQLALMDLGASKAQILLEGLRWARSFSPVRKTSAPRSVGDVLHPGDLAEIRLTKKRNGVWLADLSQPPSVQGALVALEPGTRNVVAMVGGSDFRRSPLIRAVQSRRQPGSAFKPILYAAAIDSKKFTPASIVMDTPEVYRSSLRGRAWKPRNFERVFLGQVSLRYALAHSVNTVAVKLAADLGPGHVIETARRMGIDSELKPNLSLALGTSELTPLELTNAYAVLDDLGRAKEPVFITSLRSPRGEDLSWPRDESRQAMSPAVAFVTSSLLRSVIEEGTGRKALRLGRPLAGKTGTANQQRDGWFVGYSADLVCGVWVGFDDHARMGTGWAQGAGTALPIWVDFMGRAHKDLPPREFPVPPGVVFVRVDAENGLLAQPRMEGARFEAFVEGTEPRTMSPREAPQDPDSGSVVPDPLEGRLPEGMFE